jgi:Rap1a immunity proteins
MRALVAAALMIATPAGAGYDPYFNSGTWWIAQCKKESALCDGFIGGMIQMNFLNKGHGLQPYWCLPFDSTIAQIRAVILNELSKTPDVWNKPFALIAAQVLRDKFPCPKAPQ